MNNRYGEQPIEFLVELEEQCWECDGYGRDETKLDAPTCERCDGYGVLLTEKGEALLEFIQRWRGKRGKEI